MQQLPEDSGSLNSSQYHNNKDDVGRVIFSRTEQYLTSVDKLLPVFQHGLFMSEEKLDFIILYTWKVYQKILFHNFVFGQKQNKVN